MRHGPATDAGHAGPRPGAAGGGPLRGDYLHTAVRPLARHGLKPRVRCEGRDEAGQRDAHGQEAQGDGSRIFTRAQRSIHPVYKAPLVG